MPRYKNKNHGAGGGTLPPVVESGQSDCAQAPSPTLDSGKDSQLLARLAPKLNDALHMQFSVAKRVSFLRQLHRTLLKISGQMTKPVVSSRRPTSAAGGGLTLEQHIKLLMAKNLKLALDDMDQSGMAYTHVAAYLHWWLARTLFSYLGEMIEYAVQWERLYPPDSWRMLHELYFHISSQIELIEQFEEHRAESGFNPCVEYKRLLLLGLARWLLPIAARVPELHAALPALAIESRLEHAENHAGAFELFIVDLAQDRPPRLTAVVEPGLSGWVFVPAKGFLGYLAKLDRGDASI